MGSGVWWTGYSSRGCSMSRKLLLPVEQRPGPPDGAVVARRRVRLMDDSVTAALDEVRGLVSPDGGEVELDGVDGTTYRLRLVLENAHCVECVMPRPFLEQVALDVFQRNGTDATTV